MLYAHTPNAAGEWHSLEEHSRAVAELAAEHAQAFGSEDAAWWAGMLHDAGKASEAFQSYLTLCAAQPDRKHQTVDHKGAGVLRALEVLEPLAFPLQGHHGGLIDAGNLSTKIKDHHRALTERQAALERFDALELIDGRSAPVIPPFAQRSVEGLEFWLRMLFSALVDADHFDTERHWHPETAALRGSPVAMSDLWEQFQRQQEAFVAGLDAEVAASELNRARAEVYAACLDAAAGEPGFYRLTVPTGGGKTRSGLAFALKHATLHGQRRVIMAVPYLTITDQTARIVRSIFPDERIVLEHHSAAGEAWDDEEGTQDEREVWRRLTAQDWDAPLIVTTMVQLFESLLGRRTGSCRKLHRIAGSVLVLDEAQTIPFNLREPVYAVLHELVTNYGVSVVLCTATQPALDMLPPEIVAREIVPEPERYFRALERVRYAWPAEGASKWSWEETAEIMRTREQSLAVVNTVADAAALFAALGEEAGHVHLSTRMCGAHRRETIELIRARLADGERCRVVSTQLVEAGVDLDFPLLLRAFAPLDRIVQAAGRCNREGSLPEPGEVVVFEPADGGLPPGPYRIATEQTALFREVEGEALDLNDPAVFLRYFSRLSRVIGGDKANIQAKRHGLNYETVAHDFRMIDDEDRTSVIVRYRGLDGQSTRADRVINELDQAVAVRNSGWVRALTRQAQPYLVDLRKRQFQEAQRNNDVRQLTDDLWEWLPAYDDALGVVSGRLEVEQLFID